MFEDQESEQDRQVGEYPILSTRARLCDFEARQPRKILKTSRQVFAASGTEALLALLLNPRFVMAASKGRSPERPLRGRRTCGVMQFLGAIAFPPKKGG